MAKYNTLSALFTAIANSLRRKTGSSGTIVADDFPTVIDGLSTDGITPTGTKSITSNGSHDVTTFATAEVNVPVGVTPSGTKSITANGTHDVTNYASAQVNVPVGITPSGSKTITENGTHDVTSYASAVVSVPIPAEKTAVRTITVNADIIGANSLTTLLTNDDFVKAHYNHDGFFITMFINTPVAGETYMVPCILHFNRNVGASNLTRTGGFIKFSSASANSFGNCTARIDGKGYSVHFRAASDGSLKLYLMANANIKAGTYTLVMTCID